MNSHHSLRKASLRKAWQIAAIAASAQFFAEALAGPRPLDFFVVVLELLFLLVFFAVALVAAAAAVAVERAAYHTPEQFVVGLKQAWQALESYIQTRCIPLLEGDHPVCLWQLRAEAQLLRYSLETTWT